jgi:hypothetical protein
MLLVCGGDLLESRSVYELIERYTLKEEVYDMGGCSRCLLELGWEDLEVGLFLEVSWVTKVLILSRARNY